MKFENFDGQDHHEHGLSIVKAKDLSQRIIFYIFLLVFKIFNDNVIKNKKIFFILLCLWIHAGIRRDMDGEQIPLVTGIREEDKEYIWGWGRGCIPLSVPLTSLQPHHILHIMSPHIDNSPMSKRFYNIENEKFNT